MRTITLRLDDVLAAVVDKVADDPAALAREALVLELFRRHDVSAGRAAHTLGISLEAFMKLASSRGIPVIDTTPEQWDVELAAIEAMTAAAAAPE
jgi:hypothetical protein